MKNLLIAIGLMLVCSYSFSQEINTIVYHNERINPIFETLVFNCICSGTDGNIIPATTENTITGHILMAASIPDNVSRPTGIVQIMDDSGRDIFGGRLKMDDNGIRYFSPSAVSGASDEAVFVNSRIACVPNEQAYSASFTIKVYYTQYWLTR